MSRGIAAFESEESHLEIHLGIALHATMRLVPGHGKASDCVVRPFSLEIFTTD